MTTVSVIGAGAWGSALAMVAERSQKKVTLYAHTQDEFQALKEHRNILKLPGIQLPEEIEVTSNLVQSAQANIVLLAVPAQVLRDAVTALKTVLMPDSYLVLCSKGIELKTSLLMSQVVEEILPDHSVSVFSGPTFAREVAQGLPTIATLANCEISTSRWLASSLSNDRMRLYTTTDIIGLQVAGALKNVIAIASGIITARQLGENARAALITRGLAEITRLGQAMGAEPDTFYGVGGLGDLILSCTSSQSRNFSLGIEIGSGKMDTMRPNLLTEGAYTANAVMNLAVRLDIEMPICRSVQNILENKNSVDDEIANLWARPLKNE